MGTLRITAKEQNPKFSFANKNTFAKVNMK